MHIYIFEPRESRREGLIIELERARLIPVVIDESFFASDLSILNRRGSDTRAIVLAETEQTIEYIQAIRRAECRNPILVLRDFRNSKDASNALDHGADDVLVIPVKGIEILSRINSINRRSYGHVAESVTVGEIVAYFDGRDPEVSGERLRLSKREHAIFQHLILNSNRVISKGAIYDAVYGMDDDQPFDKVIDVYICKLRKKISAATEDGHKYIETVYGRGYKFGMIESPASKHTQYSAAVMDAMRIPG